MSHQLSHSCWLHQELPQLGEQKAEAPKITIHRVCLAHPMASSCWFSPHPAWFPRHCWDVASEMLRWSQVTSLTMRPTHPCITIPTLLALPAPCGIPNAMAGQNLGCEAECSHKQLHQPCRAASADDLKSLCIQLDTRQSSSCLGTTGDTSPPVPTWFWWFLYLCVSFLLPNSNAYQQEPAAEKHETEGKQKFTSLYTDLFHMLN